MKQLPAGRNEPRTRLYLLREWDTPVFDSTTSDMHPVDFLLYGPYTELNVVIDYGTGSWRQRWSGTWCQTSRRKFTEHNHYEFLEKLLHWPDLKSPPAVEIPPALLRDIPEPTDEERRRSLRYQPVSEVLAGVIEDANLTITVDNTAVYRGPGYTHGR